VRQMHQHLSYSYAIRLIRLDKVCSAEQAMSIRGPVTEACVRPIHKVCDIDYIEKSRLEVLNVGSGLGVGLGVDAIKVGLRADLGKKASISYASHLRLCSSVLRVRETRFAEYVAGAGFVARSI
jgi:hypothetical protein